MHTALALNTVFNARLDADFIAPALEHLVATQAVDGSWPAEAYYYGGPMKTVSWGGRELTTGLCLEALQRAGSVGGGGGR